MVEGNSESPQDSAARLCHSGSVVAFLSLLNPSTECSNASRMVLQVGPSQGVWGRAMTDHESDTKDRDGLYGTWPSRWST